MGSMCATCRRECCLCPELRGVVGGPFEEGPWRCSCELRKRGCHKRRLTDGGSPRVEQHIHQRSANPGPGATQTAPRLATSLRRAVTAQSRVRWSAPARPASAIAARSPHIPHRRARLRTTCGPRPRPGHAHRSGPLERRGTASARRRRRESAVPRNAGRCLRTCRPGGTSTPVLTFRSAARCVRPGLWKDWAAGRTGAAF